MRLITPSPVSPPARGGEGYFLGNDHKTRIRIRARICNSPEFSFSIITKFVIGQTKNVNLLDFQVFK
jgi:hypothetical protein